MHWNVQQPPTPLAGHLSYEQVASFWQSAFAKHAFVSALHSLVYAPVVLLVQSLQNWYAPLPLEDADEVDEPDEPDDDAEELDDAPDEPDDDDDVLVSPEELEELAVLEVLDEPVSSVQAPNPKSAHEATKIAPTPR